MESFIARANKGNFGGAEIKQYWKYDWYTPIPIDTNTNNSHSNSELGRSSDGSGVKKYPFKFKTWLKTEKSVLADTQDEDIGDLFDLSMHSGTDNTNLVNTDGIGAQRGSTRDGGLTMEDIRGAVGDGEAIPGLSGSDAARNVEEKIEANNKAVISEASELPNSSALDPEAKGASEQPVTMETATSTQLDTEQKDVDGDIGMQ